MGQPMSTKTFYIDVDGKNMVAGPQQTQIVSPLAPFILTDALILNVYAQFRSLQYPLGDVPFIAIPAAGLALSAVVGIRDIVGAPLLASTFNFSADPTTGAFWSGVLNLNTQAMLQYMGDGNQANPWLEIFFVDNAGNRTTIFESQITVLSPVYNGQAPVPEAPQVGASQQWVGQTFVPIVGAPGAGIYLVSQDGTKKIFLYCGNDGQDHADAVQ